VIKKKKKQKFSWHLLTALLISAALVILGKEYDINFLWYLGSFILVIVAISVLVGLVTGIHEGIIKK